mmetsp:Transcript_46102/g.67299  ORF Transcript_46102/g.67299 Transcript_46102/m.67299 type:complete len:195 (+) Transcript_46102:51-635(+)
MDFGISGSGISTNSGLPPRKPSSGVQFGGYRPKSSKALALSSRQNSVGSSRGSSRGSSQASSRARAFKDQFEAEAGQKVEMKEESSGFKLEGGVTAEPTQAKPVAASGSTPKAVKCRRAKTWSIEAEWQFRLQETGWKDIYEYKQVYGEPERWPTVDLPKCLRTKEAGLYSYWKPTRECPDKFVPRVKLYEYES